MFRKSKRLHGNISPNYTWFKGTVFNIGELLMHIVICILYKVHTVVPTQVDKNVR